MPSTAWTVPREVSKRTCRSCTSSRGGRALSRDKLSDKAPPTLDSDTRAFFFFRNGLAITDCVGNSHPNELPSVGEWSRVSSPLADLAQNFRRVFAEPRGGALRRHRSTADDDRRAYARDRTGLGCRARRVDPHPAMDDLRVGENLVKGIDRPGWNPYRLELGQ